MKKIVKFAMVLFVALTAVACSNNDNIGDEYLDVTPNNISGTWKMESFDNGSVWLEGVYYYKSGSISYNAGTKRDNSTLPDLSKYSGWDQNYWMVPILDENDKKLSYPVPYKSEMLY